MSQESQGLMERLGDAWTARAPSILAYALAAAIGVGLYVLVFGPGMLVGTSDYWDLPLTDHRAYIIGYRYFEHEPWQWPVFVTQTMNVPYPKSIAFTDSIPLWAFVNKAVATVIPPWDAYSTHGGFLGLWYALIFALQAVSAVACVRALGHRSWGATLVTALMFVAVPAWTLRYVHASMAAHFLTLWALYLYLRTPAKAATPAKLRIAQIAQLAIASLVNPYHTVMSFGLFAASVLRARKLREVAYLPVAMATIGVGLWLAGYFVAEAKGAVFGFEAASTNVLSAFMPYRSGFVGDAAWVDPTGFQYEGVAYLGIGFLVLLVLFLPRARSLGGVIRRHPFLFVVALGAWLFALSTHIYVGPYKLVAYELPSFMRWLADQFRSPGRFVWVPMYVALVFLIKEGLARFRTGWTLMILPVLAMLQLIDASGDLRAHRNATRGPDNPRIELAPWRTLVAAHDRVFIMPSYDCVLDGTKDMDYVSLDIQYLVSERALPINGVYSARPTRNCLVDWHTMLRTKPEGKALYVLLRRVQAASVRFEALGATCGEFAFGRVCSLVKPAIAEAIRAGALTPTPPAPSLAFGTKLELGGEASAAYFELGWSWPEGTSRWTDGPVARLAFRPTGEPSATPTLKLQASTVICGGRTQQDLEVSINGVAIGSQHFDAQHNDPKLVRSIPVAKSELLRAPIVVIELRPSDYRAATVVGCNQDPRNLGVAVERMWIE